jgi:RNA polymerase sigma-70 factor (ECF subfamily)
MWARRAVRESEIRADASSSEQRAAAFRRVADGSLHDAYRLAGAILRDPSESRDAVHDAFITAWQRWPSLRDQTKFDSWFKRIVVNVCRERLRVTTRRASSDIESQTSLPAPGPSLEIHERLLVEESLTRLKPDDRIVIALRYFHDLKVGGIATVLDVPPGTVKSRLNHAHSRLRAVMERSQSSGGSR